METSLYAFINLIKVKENQQMTDFIALGLWLYLKYAFMPVNLEIDVLLALFI